MPSRIKIPSTSSSISSRKIDRSSDPYGGLATIAQDEDIIISPISQWDLAQNRAWPPLPYQAYCEKHFLQECLVYYSLMVEELKQQEEKIESLATEMRRKEQRLPVSSGAPKRVQPRRGAKEAAVEKVSPAEAVPKEAKAARTKLEVFQKRRELHLAWPIFCARLKGKLYHLYVSRQSEAKYVQERKGYVGDSLDRIEAGWRHHRCMVEQDLSLECRYCQHRPTNQKELKELKEQYPMRVAPVAPMHLIEKSHIDAEQKAEFGGIKFAVDICGEEVKIVLLDMPVFDLELHVITGNINQIGMSRIGHDADTKLSVKRRKEPAIKSAKDGQAVEARPMKKRKKC